MEKNFTQGYAVILGKDDSDADVEYFLAHHGVRKGPKLRVVFDAAAKFRGKSLNDSLLSGPALQTSLPSVILKFREGEIAWASDVEAMFSRIRMRREDARYFRFLWQRKGDDNILKCEMRRLPFGATCSPFIAIHTTRRVAADFNSSPDVTKAITEKMYVDDYLGSSKTVAEGVREAVGVRDTLAKGDLHLQGWISNSPELLTAVGATPDTTTDSVGLSLDGDGLEKVLGIIWKPSTDTIGFRVTNVEDVQFTHAGLLSKVASIFDPQGSAAPLTVKAKIKLRLLSIRGLGWSENVVGEDRVWWERWFRSLTELNDVQFPRCLFKGETDIVRTELHTFGDASEEAYAAVCYIRNIYNDGSSIVRHVKAATKLAPKKVASIPKLELNAALLASRLARTVQQALTRDVKQRFFWTDSSTVRNWIRAPAASYQIFVANRIGEIQTLTDAAEWRFVPGKLNPADLSTRSVIEEGAIASSWLSGPDFLQEKEENWPKDLPWMAVTAELRPVRVNQSCAEGATLVDWETVSFTPREIPALAKLEGSIVDLLRKCQAEVYTEDIQRLKKNKKLRSTSSLLSLAPFLGGDGLVRLGRRIKKLPYDHVYPPILPGRHKLARLIITAFHQELNHVGTDFLLAYLQHYIWLTGGREAVKKVRRECRVCKKERAKPGEQQMGDLPHSRLEFGVPPFTNTACDLFGPIEVGLPRNRSAKRWGVLFTCLVTRAVYLDIVPSLSSGDFLLALRRFIGIYGKPKRIHSDNGTNFVGGERELREEAEKLYGEEELASFFKEKSIEWTFQPPRAPHFGGAHESLVKSTKRALYRALDEEKGKFRHPTEDLLKTLLFEVAGLLNTRPLTYTSSDPTDFRPLTPNDFMNRPPVADVPAGEFDSSLPRDHYRYVQKMLNIFWDMWKSSYLQSLSSRKKWRTEQPNFQVGSVVMEIDKTLKRGEWNIGHVVRVYPGEDGLVRAVDVELPSGIFRRAIHRLCLLEPVSSGSPSASPDSGENVPAKTI